MLTIRHTIDRRGDVIESRLFDAEGKPATNASGISVERVKRDGRGRAIERSYFQTNDKPAINRAEGGAILRFKYDELGTVREKEVLDTTGRVLRTLGYDAEGNLTK